MNNNNNIYVFIEAIDKIKLMLKSGEIQEAQILFAKIRKNKFEALMKEGFTESQALELCKSIEVI